MKITVSEALRLKNEISSSICQLQSKSRYASYGVTKEDGIEKQAKSDIITFPDYLKLLEKAFGISEQINSKLAELSVRTKISDMVRHKANLLALKQTLEFAALNSTSNAQIRHETVGAQRVAITTTFEPFMTKKDIKAKIKALKAEIRTIQSMVDAENAQQIELPFEYDDLEDFCIQESVEG